jgi:hypothetical protein
MEEYNDLWKPNAWLKDKICVALPAAHKTNISYNVVCQWLFDRNIKFTVGHRGDGTYWYFYEKDDAVRFKLRWG